MWNSKQFSFAYQDFLLKQTKIYTTALWRYLTQKLGKLTAQMLTWHLFWQLKTDAATQHLNDYCLPPWSTTPIYYLDMKILMSLIL